MLRYLHSDKEIGRWKLWIGWYLHVKMHFILLELVSDLPRFLSPPEPGRGVIRAYVALQHSTGTWYTTRALYTHLHCSLTHSHREDFFSVKHNHFEPTHSTRGVPSYVKQNNLCGCMLDICRKSAFPDHTETSEMLFNFVTLNRDILRR